jgi:hypothetical protein
MRFLKVLALLVAATVTVVLAAPTSSSSLQVSNVTDTSSAAEAINCPKATRYACGQYMLEDGIRQDFVSQVYKCIPRDEFHCNYFHYSPYNPSNPDKPSHMIAAKVDPGCTCAFYM